MACPEYLRQHVLQHGVPQTLEHLKEVTAERKAKTSQAMLNYEADERDFFAARQAEKDHSVVCAACDK